MSDEQLKPCPFCGGEARYMLADVDDDGYCVECTQCWASSRVHLSLKDDARPIVAAAWNRRVPQAGSVPVEAIQQCMEDLITYQMGNPFMVDPETIAIATVRAWLDAQPTQGQE